MKRFALLALVLFIPAQPSQAAGLNGAIIYIVPDSGGAISAYQEGAWASPIAKYTGVPGLSKPVRGVTAQGDYLYISWGGSGGGQGNGGVTKWNMVTQTTAWSISQNTGVDLLSVCPNGNVYVPNGENSTTNKITILSAATGNVTGQTTAAGNGPHDSVCMPSGGFYVGAVKSGYLKTPQGNVGPNPPGSQAGVRPFTVSANESLVYMTYTHYRGFAVGSTATGKLVASVNFGPVPSGFTDSAPSHGISLNPNGSDVWVLDQPNGQVREYTAGSSPSLVATVTLQHTNKTGWLLNTLDGKYVLVGKSGDIISTSTHSVIAHNTVLAQSHHGYIEVDWSNGSPIATSTHVGVGH